MTATGAAVIRALRAELADALPTDAAILDIAPYVLATTHRAFAVRVERGGEPCTLIFKDMSPEAELPAAIGTRPSFVVDPGRAPMVHGSVLGSSAFTPRCWATRCDDEARQWWVLLQEVEGDPLWQRGEGSAWEATARTLAALHASGLGGRLDDAVRARLLVHDARYTEVWRRRTGARQDASVAATALAKRCGPLPEMLSTHPKTVIHGECYSSNVIVSPTEEIVLIDWEMAAIGSPLSDLAALVSGWDDANIQLLARSYWAALTDRGCYSSFGKLLEMLDTCRLQECLQWLGWADAWQPPEEHRQDWATTGHHLADRLGL